MSGLEICLIIIGAIVIAVSFIFSEHLTGVSGDELQNKKIAEITEEMVRKEVGAEMANIIDEKLEEAKKELNKVTTDKIMALGEYSDDVNLRINKNHEEVMFLYNMLNDKEVVIKNTIKDIEALKTSVKKMAIVNDFSDGEKVSTASEVASGEKAKSSVNDTVDIKTGEGTQVNNENDKPKKSKINLKSSNNNKKILELYSNGVSNIEIAKKLGLGVGEVRLVIDLFNSRKN